MKKYLKYKGVTVNAFGLPVLFSKNKVARKGETKRRYSNYKHFIHNFTPTTSKDLIVICDFPFSRRSERDWFRYQLKGLNYSRIQKSVWVGPSPLPKDFLVYVKSIGLLGRLKILKLAEPYSKNNLNFR